MCQNSQSPLISNAIKLLKFPINSTWGSFVPTFAMEGQSTQYHDLDRSEKCKIDLSLACQSKLDYLNPKKYHLMTTNQPQQPIYRAVSRRLDTKEKNSK
jgi:hypothetical protein